MASFKEAFSYFTPVKISSTSQFLQSKHLNELILYIAPKLIGGSGKHQFYKTDEVIDLPEATQFEIVDSKLINQNLKLKLRKK